MRKLLFCFIIFNFCNEIENTFSIVGPRTVLHGEDYQIHVVKTNSDEDFIVLELKFEGHHDGDISEETITLEESLYVHTFEIADRSIVENYTLTATISGSSDHTSIDIFTIDRTKSALIQTDKSIYSPGDNVKFRVLLLDEKMRLHHFREIGFKVSDPIGNTVYKNNAIKSEPIDGVFEDKFAITESSLLGDFRMEVFLEGKIIDQKTILVSDQVATRFLINIRTKPATRFSDKVLTLHIDIRHMFGALAKGRVTINAILVLDGKEWKGRTKAIDNVLNGIVTFNLIEDLNLSIDIKKVVFATLDLEFLDAVSGLKETKRHRTSICMEACHKIDIAGQKLKPGFSYSFQVNVVDMTTAKLEISEINKLFVNVFYRYSDSNCNDEGIKSSEITQESFLKAGSANFLIDVPHNTSFITITASYLLSKKSIKVITQEPNLESQLKLTMENKRPSIGDEIELKVESSSDLDEFHAVVMQGSKIVFSQTFDAIFNTEFEFSFPSTDEMKPTVNVVVYYVPESNQIIHDELKIDFVDKTESSLELSTTPAKLLPGSPCSISISSSFNSIVTLIAVNQQTLLDENFDWSLLNPKFNQKTVQYLRKDQSLSSNLVDSVEFNSFIITDIAANNDICVSERIGGKDDGKDKFENENEDDLEDVVEDDKKLKESWIFKALKTDDEGLAILQETVPDSITTWAVAALAINSNGGLTLSKQYEVEVSKKSFFIKFDLPNSVRFNEILKIDAFVISELPDQSEDMKVNVTLFRSEDSEDFEFIEKIAECSTLAYDHWLVKNKMLNISPNSIGVVSFIIRPLRTGTISIRMKASIEGQLDYDEVVKNLTVAQEGSTTYRSDSWFFDLRNTSSLGYSFALPIPNEAFARSIRIEGSVLVELLEPNLLDTRNLIRKPSATNENSALLKYIQSMVSMRYLLMTDQAKTMNRTAIIDHLRNGYNQIAERRQSDGSFEFKGHSRYKSIWLTAYIAKCLGQVDVISVNETYIKDALAFLKKQQYSDNSFDSHNKSISGGFIEFGEDKNNFTVDVTLTALVVISFLENPKHAKDFRSVIDRALLFLDQNVISTTKTYELALSAYALSLAKHEAANDLLESLRLYAKRGSDKIYWEVSLENNKTSTHTDLSEQIEIASYALLAFLHSEHKSRYETDCLGIMLWIISQVEENDGVFSKKDSVVTAQALAEVAKTYFSSAMNLSVNLFYGNGRQTSFHIEKSNSYLTRNFEFPSNVRHITLNANGTGFFLLNVLSNYDTIVENFTNPFFLSVTVEPSSSEENLHLTACTNVKADDISEEDSNNDDDVDEAIMEVKLPSGYVFDSLYNDLQTKLSIKKVETKHHKSTVLIHFDRLNKEKICPEIRAIRERIIDESQRSTVKVYRGIDKRAIEYYTTRGSQYCDYGFEDDGAMHD